MVSERTLTELAYSWVVGALDSAVRSIFQIVGAFWSIESNPHDKPPIFGSS